MERVTGLHRVGLRVTDLAEALEFYEVCWGMKPADDKNGAQRYFRSNGEDHDDLVLLQGEGSGLDHYALSVANKEQLDCFLESLIEAGHTIVKPAAKGERPGDRWSATVLDVDGYKIELVVPDKRHAELNSSAPFRRPGHIVLWTNHMAAQEEFYALLGFQVSDRTHLGMSFLRCNRDHHTVALAQSKNGVNGLQHVAYDIGGVDEVMREFARLSDCGIKCIWGVGRHGPGNNVFSYFTDPAGNVVENYGEMEQVELSEEIKTRFWGPEHKGDIWGVAGPPPLSFRK